ncbi:MAG: hypothetical protein QME64_01455 [bacterium]|nr:hypothetical protein [bacterium]
MNRRDISKTKQFLFVLIITWCVLWGSGIHFATALSTITTIPIANLRTDVDPVVSPDSTRVLVPATDGLRIINPFAPSVLANLGLPGHLVSGVDVVCTLDSRTAVLPTQGGILGVNLLANTPYAFTPLPGRVVYDVDAQIEPGTNRVYMPTNGGVRIYTLAGSTVTTLAIPGPLEPGVDLVFHPGGTWAFLPTLGGIAVLNRTTLSVATVVPLPSGLLPDIDIRLNDSGTRGYLPTAAHLVVINGTTNPPSILTIIPLSSGSIVRSPLEGIDVELTPDQAFALLPVQTIGIGAPSPSALGIVNTATNAISFVPLPSILVPNVDVIPTLGSITAAIPTQGFLSFVNVPASSLIANIPLSGSIVSGVDLQLTPDGTLGYMPTNGGIDIFAIGSAVSINTIVFYSGERLVKDVDLFMQPNPGYCVMPVVGTLWLFAVSGTTTGLLPVNSFIGPQLLELDLMAQIGIGSAFLSGTIVQGVDVIGSSQKSGTQKPGFDPDWDIVTLPCCFAKPPIPPPLKPPPHPPYPPDDGRVDGKVCDPMTGKAVIRAANNQQLMVEDKVTGTVETTMNLTGVAMGPMFNDWYNSDVYQMITTGDVVRYNLSEKSTLIIRPPSRPRLPPVIDYQNRYIAFRLKDHSICIMNAKNGATVATISINTAVRRWLGHPIIDPLNKYLLVPTTKKEVFIQNLGNLASPGVYVTLPEIALGDPVLDFNKRQCLIKLRNNKISLVNYATASIVTTFTLQARPKSPIYWEACNNTGLIYTVDSNVHLIDIHALTVIPGPFVGSNPRAVGKPAFDVWNRTALIRATDGKIYRWLLTPPYTLTAARVFGDVAAISDPHINIHTKRAVWLARDTVSQQTTFICYDAHKDMGVPTMGDPIPAFNEQGLAQTPIIDAMNDKAIYTYPADSFFDVFFEVDLSGKHHEIIPVVPDTTKSAIGRFKHDPINQDITTFLTDSTERIFYLNGLQMPVSVTLPQPPSRVVDRTPPPPIIETEIISMQLTGMPNTFLVKGIARSPGPVEPNSIVRIDNISSPDAEPVYTLADVDGTFEAEIAGEPTDQITVTAIDGEGNESSPSSPMPVTVPTAAPLFIN